jgi:hypothetical protein
MSVLKKLGINSETPFLCLIGSLSNVGKTTILKRTALEFANGTNKVLFISEDHCNSLKNNINIVVKEIPSINKPLHELTNINEFSHIIIDSIVEFELRNSFFDELREFVNNGTVVIISDRLRKQFDNSGLIDGFHNRGVLISDYVITLSKEVKLTFFEKIKYFFIGSKPNMTLNLQKNRYGNKATIKAFINFKQY